ncbi:MAG: DUF4097 family beta strand repeat protein [Acidobacteria bacterium]|nr:DUF4097 family beta strand repeat protein [Acidobacteriota bacterium]
MVFALSPIVAVAQPIVFERSLTVGAAPTLEASTGSGNVTVRGGAGSTVLVKGTIEVRTGWNAPPNAADLARRLAANPPIVQTGDVVTVGNITDEETRRAVKVSYEITVPTTTTVTARSGSGNVSVAQVDGRIKANSGSGNVSVASAGNDIDARTGSGNVSVTDARRTASLSSGSGNIVATLSGQGDVKASTGSGNIRLTGVVGLLSANTGSGNIGVDGTPTGDWKLSAASGDVKVRVPADRGFVVDASTASGSLDMGPALTLQGKIDRRRIQGTVRGGGPTLRLSTASGNIAVQ